MLLEYLAVAFRGQKNKIELCQLIVHQLQFFLSFRAPLLIVVIDSQNRDKFLPVFAEIVPWLHLLRLQLIPDNQLLNNVEKEVAHLDIYSHLPVTTTISGQLFV